jgi:hypothetical protein
MSYKKNTIPGPDVLAPANIGDDDWQDNARNGVPVLWHQNNDHQPNQQQLDDADRFARQNIHVLAYDGPGGNKDYGGNYDRNAGSPGGNADKFDTNDVGTDR